MIGPRGSHVGLLRLRRVTSLTSPQVCFQAYMEYESHITVNGPQFGVTKTEPETTLEAGGAIMYSSWLVPLLVAPSKRIRGDINRRKQ